MPSTCFISELLPLALRCHFSHVWLEEIRNKLVKNVASESNSLWPSPPPPLFFFFQSIRASFWGELHGHLLISEKPAAWACTVEQLFVSFDCDTSGLALPGLSHQHCFLWLCFIHNNQGLAAVSSKEQASKSSHKFQPNTMFGSSSRLMTTLSCLRLIWDPRWGGIHALFSISICRDGRWSASPEGWNVGLYSVPPACLISSSHLACRAL